MSAVLIGLALALAGWAAARWAAKAWRPGPVGAVAMDLAIPLLVFVLALGLSGRPIFSGIVSLSLIGGFAFADWGKRTVLREPVVFTDMAELVELVRHPHLYLPYVGTGRVLAGAAAAAVLVAGLLAFEPALDGWRWWTPGVTALCAAAVLALGCGPFLAPSAALFRRWAWTGEPVADSARLGGLAMQFVYGMTARCERPRRRVDAPALSAPALGGRACPPSVVLVQSESFFDPRRLGAGTGCSLQAFDEACGAAFSAGLLRPPSWGANTVRTEFEVLTGAGRAVTGLDWFNPYHQFARTQLSSLAWALKAQGYRTICVHPFDGGFYGRREVLPQLGFDTFLDQAAFAGQPREGRYVSDLALAQFANGLLGARQPTFLFLITIENHGPWPDPALPVDAAAPDAAFDSYVRGIGRSDRMIRELMEGARRRGHSDLVAFYGDHLPTLSQVFERHDFHETATDYFIWSEGLPAGPRADLAADQLGSAILKALEAHACRLGPSDSLGDGLMVAQFDREPG